MAQGSSKLGLSIIVLLSCGAFLVHEYKDDPRIMELLGKLPFVTSPDEAEELPATWPTFVHGGLHYSLSYPDTYTVQKNDDERRVNFLRGNEPKVVVRAVRTAERLEKGLWITDEPMEQARLGGRPAKLYVTRERQGNEIHRTLCYVAERDGMLVSLEFRTDRSKLGEIEQRMLDSFQFDEKIGSPPVETPRGQ
jgi:hypothetical protein